MSAEVTYHRMECSTPKQMEAFFEFVRRQGLSGRNVHWFLEGSGTSRSVTAVSGKDLSLKRAKNYKKRREFFMNRVDTLLSEAKKIGEDSCPVRWAGGLVADFTRGITSKHRALIWENMLGTVYVQTPDGTVVYCDYDYAKARKLIKEELYTDFRVAKSPQMFRIGKGDFRRWIDKGQTVFWGRPK